jgi:hypothetical protein
VWEFFAFIGGYGMMVFLQEKGKVWVFLFYGAIGILLFLVFYLPLDRYGWIGTSEEYLSGSATPLFSTLSSLLEWGAIGLWFALWILFLLFRFARIRKGFS